MRREVGWFLILCAVVTGVLLVGNNHWHRFVSRTRGEPGTAGPDYSQVPATWVGRGACLECHAAADSLWNMSDHARAMQLPGPDTITADFQNASFTHFGVTTTFTRDGDRYLVRTDGRDGHLADFEVAYVFGYYPLEQFLIRFPDGRLQALNVCWDARPAADGGQRWFHLYPDNPTPATDLFHWTGMLQNWNYMCAECHTTDLRRGYNPANDTYQTTWSELGVSCEACHGPGSRHVLWEKAAARNLRPRDDTHTRGLVFSLKAPDDGGWAFAAGDSIATRTNPLGSRIEAESCARCHARRTALTGDYRYGQPFGDHYRLRLLEENYYYADGQNQDEVYVYGSFLQSKMWAAGVTCSDCHDVHTGSTLGEGNQVCAKCHLATAFDTPTHHFHQPGQGGDSCLDCHQEARNLMVVDARRDHSFRIPRPDLSLAIGTPNACNDCHQDKSFQWAQDAIVKWYGPGRKQGPHYAIALHAGRTGEPGALDRLRFLVKSVDQPGIVRATAISLIPGYAAAAEIPEVVAALQDAEPLVRAAAIRSLDSSSAARRLALATPLLSDPIYDVRLAAARLIANLPDEAAANGLDVSQAEGIWRNYLAEHLERPENLVELAELQAAKHQTARADSTFKQAIARENRYVGSYLNYADFLRRRGRVADARTVLTTGIRTATEPAALHHSLGLLLVGEKNLTEALVQLRLASEAQPGSARYSYVYAVALHDAGRGAESLDVLAANLNRHPWDQASLQAVVIYALEQKQSQRALAPAEKLVRLRPNDQRARRVLQQLRKDLR